MTKPVPKSSISELLSTEPDGGSCFYANRQKGEIMNKGNKKNEITVAEACAGAFCGTLIAVLASILLYYFLEGTAMYLRGILSLDLGAMAGVMVGLPVARAGYNERERARRRRERRALRDFEGYKRIVREGNKKYPYSFR